MKKKIEYKINAIEHIIETIDDSLEGIDIDESTSKKVEYLNSRKDINLKKLKACQELAMNIG